MFIHFVTGQRVAPFTPAAARTAASVYHSVTGLADRGSILINYNFIRDRLWPAPAGVKIDKRLDVPCFAKIVCGIIVIRRIKTQILDGNIGVSATKFLKHSNPADAVAVFCVQKTDM